MSANSTALVRPAKPRPDFPLFPHANGRWAKKVLGKLKYFGKWSDDPKGEAAINLWLDQKDELLSGRKPRPKRGGISVVDLVNQFLEAKEDLVASGELKQRTWKDYHTVCARVLKIFGKARSVPDLQADDFAELRSSFATTRGPVALTGDITRVRVLFKWGYDNGLITEPMRYGQSFNKPSQRTLRIEKAKNGKRMFEREQLLAMLNGRTLRKKKLDGATLPLRAMILLAINGGLGNSDAAQLPLAALNLKSGWIDYPRPKTGIERRIPLWPETIAALKKWIPLRPTGRNDEIQQLVFITRAGKSWDKDDDDNPISKETAKLLQRLEMHSPGLNFYSIRRTFRTIASESRDEAAADAIMGHAPDSDDMAAVYRQGIKDDRLVAVTNHVRHWLFPKTKKA